MHKSTVISLMAVPLAISAVPVEAYAQDTQSTTEWKDVEGVIPGWTNTITVAKTTSGDLINAQTGEVIGIFSSRGENYLSANIEGLEAGKKYRLLLPFGANIKVSVNGQEIGGIDHKGNFYRGTFNECNSSKDNFIQNGWSELATNGLEFEAVEGTNTVKIEVLYNGTGKTPLFQATSEWAYKAESNGDGTSTIKSGKDKYGSMYGATTWSDILTVNFQLDDKSFNQKKFIAFFPTLQVAEVNQGGGEIVNPDPGTVDMEAWQYYQEINLLTTELGTALTNFNTANTELQGQLGITAEVSAVKDKAQAIYDKTLKERKCLSINIEDKDKAEIFSNAENYEKDKAAFNAAKAQIEALTALQNTLKNTVVEVKELGKVSYTGYVTIELDIAKKSEEKVAEILNAMCSLKDYGEESIAAINSSISALPVSAAALKDAAEKVNTTLKPIYEGIEAMWAMISSEKKADKRDVEKKIVSTNEEKYAEKVGSVYPFSYYSSDKKDFSALESGYKCAVNDKTFDECLSYLEGLPTTSSVTSLTSFVITDSRDIAKQITTDNKNSAIAEFNRVNKILVDSEDFEGKDDIKTELQGIYSNLVLINSDDDVETLKGTDTRIQELIDNIKTEENKISAYISAERMYNELVESLLQAYRNLDELEKKNEKEAGLAKDHFKKEHIDKYREEMNSLATVDVTGETPAVIGGSMKEAFDTDKLTFVDNCKGENGFKNRIETLLTDIAGTVSAIDLNGDRNRQLLSIDEKIRKVNEARYAYLTGDELPEENRKLDVVQGWILDLRQLLDEDLKALADEATAAYMVDGLKTEVDGKTKFEDLMERYNELEKTINPDTQDWEKIYENSVVEHNDETAGDWRSIELEELNQLYLKGIQKLNKYVYGFKNKGYSTAVKDGVSTINLYDYRKKIDDLEKEIQGFIDEKNAALLVFTSPDFEANALTPMANLKKEITDTTEELMAKAMEVAVKYYEKLYTECEANIASQKSKLEENGINPMNTLLGEFLTTVMEVSDKEQNIFPIGIPEQTEEEYKLGREGYIEAMDGIASDLDKLKVEINLDDAAKSQWTAVYVEKRVDPETGEEIPNQKKRVEDLKKQYTEFASVPEDYKEQYDAALEAISDTDSRWTTLGEGWFVNYKAYAGEMDQEIDELERVVNAIKDYNENNQELKQLKETWTTNVSNLREALEAFRSYSEGLAAESELAETVNTLEGRIKTEIEDKVNSLSSPNDPKLEEMKSSQATISEGIDDCYGSFRLLEIELLKSYIEKSCKIAYNDAQDATGGNLSETVKGYNTRFDEILSKVDEASSFTDPKADADKFRTDALAWEQELAEKCSELQKIGGKVNDVDAALKALDDKHLEVENALFDARENLYRYHASLKTDDNYNTYDTFENRLEQLKGEWLAEGNKVALHKDNYLAELSSLIDEVNDLKAKLDEENEKAVKQQLKEDASNARYEVLLAQYNGLEKAVSDFEELLAGWEKMMPEDDISKEENESYYKEWYTNNFGSKIDSWYGMHSALEDVKTDLENRKVKYELTADSELLANSIAENLRTLKSDAFEHYAGDALYYSETRLSNLNGILKGNIVKDVKGKIEKEREAVQNKNYDLFVEYWGYDALEDGDEKDGFYSQVRTEALGYADQYDDLAARAAENTFVPGDVDCDGVVTVIDYQQLLSLVGEATDYAILYAENAPKACAADANDDAVINVADLSRHANILMGETRQQAFMNRMKAPAMIGENHLTLRLDSEENGVRRYAVVLDNADAFCNGQIDVKVSGNATIANVALADRAKNHDINRFDGEFGSERVILSSMENEVFNGNSGEILFIEVEGAGNVSVDNVIFADPNARSYNLTETGGTTLIDSIIEGAKSVKEGIYNAAGQAFDKIQRGINIIRHKDGKTTKEMHKK